MDGYGNDATASTDLGLGAIGDYSAGYSAPSVSGGGGSPSDGGTAAAIAQIFSTGVTAYVDSQAIQRGYSINNPQYFAAGYPGGIGNPYGATPQGAGIVAPGARANTGLLLIAL